MTELVRWETEDGPVVVELDAGDPGFTSVSRRPGEAVADAAGHLEQALGVVRNTAAAALRSLRDGVFAPDTIELEMGVKLNAEAGAVIARTSAEAHLIVRLTWNGHSSQQ
ncbi:hypothetical protein G5C51_29460 [Streptomyces sp. A7024]|uniref:Trypsin-co-occurring domain-containing protein n=1 Tax=Streptomyces coryli TaxID=1128680 RepID=A0A6G4U6Z6_9ACTN|nr:CU044_2847 family protein [Streptomyces coryli]NGN68015.1 hypothetical protein [Streptomyces coryli]